MAKRRHRKPRGHVRDLSTTTSFGMGPVGFDIKMARRHGWRDDEIQLFWERVIPLYLRVSRRISKRRPDLHIKTKDGTDLYVGPDENGNWRKGYGPGRKS